MEPQSEAANDVRDVLRSIGHRLMEDDAEEKARSYQGSLALQAVEMSFYDALNHSDEAASETMPDSSVPQSLSYPVCDEHDSHLPFRSPLSSASDLLCQSESVMLQFKKGVEDASQFLPVTEKSFPIFCLESDKLPTVSNDDNSTTDMRAEEKETRTTETEVTLKTLEGRRSHCPDKRGGGEDDRISELFERLFLNPQESKVAVHGVDSQDLASKVVSSTSQSLNGTKAKKQKGKNKRGNKEKEDVLDLRKLLLDCAHATAADERTRALDLLKQIRKHSDPFGDGAQRLAHYLADGLEARLAGTGFLRYTAIALRPPSVAEVLNCYRSVFSAAPFWSVLSSFTGYHILRLAEKATTIHIIDFGVMFAFRWPLFFRQLSARPGGPPKLRITGIELPHPAFWASYTVDWLRRHVEKYGAQFNVPLEYNGIVNSWETIQIEDLNISSNRNGEAILVNCLFQLDNLPDETVGMCPSSPRMAVFNLIRRVNPDVFVHCTGNGSFSSPTFLARFREAMYHYSAWFDMFDSILGRENQERHAYERDTLGKDIMNVVACEGAHRIFRPVRHKQWAALTVRSGFTPLKLDEERMESLRAKMEGYHEHFGLNKEGEWALLGWKGRPLMAITGWTPAELC